VHFDGDNPPVDPFEHGTANCGKHDDLLVASSSRTKKAMTEAHDGELHDTQRV
jgi:hypothetical protein